MGNLKKSDLQIAAVTTTGSTTKAFSMAHQMGLVSMTIGTSQVYKKYIHYVNQGTTGYSSDKVTITASSKFGTNIPYSYDSKYYYITNGSATFETTSTGITKWSSFSLSPSEGCYIQKSIVPTATYYYETWAYSFKNSVQSMNVTKGKKYFYEVWGACGGGYGAHRHPEGGYSCGYKTFSGSGNQPIYIVTGGRGKCCYETADLNHYSSIGASESYNGGGKNYGYSTSESPYRSASPSAGGATHIGLKTGLLTAFKSDYATNLLVVAGGGGCNGGSYELLNPTSPHSVGGGTNGANCRYSNGGGFSWAYVGARGASLGSQGAVKGSFGQGASGNVLRMGSGGGGFMGGNSGVNDSCPGGGGSAYIGGLDTSGRNTQDGNSEVPAPGGGTQHGNGYTSTTEGNGYAMISLCPIED